MDDVLEDLRTGLEARYAVEGEIARGGMATIIRAHDVRHDRVVALKVLHPDLAMALGEDRFRREIRVTAQFTHPGILPVLDSGECPSSSGGTHLWYAMPYIEGHSLRHRLQQERQLPVEEVTSIGRDVARALDFAHRQGVVHRDVKPENILLQDGRALLADFGIARAIDVREGQRLTASGISLGTPAYMSPEQSMAEPVDARTDIFALGCVLYEALVGEPPFTGPTAQAILARMLVEAPRPIEHVRPQAAALAPIVLRALARTPADRFATARDLATALEGIGGQRASGAAGSPAPSPDIAAASPHAAPLPPPHPKRAAPSRRSRYAWGVCAMGAVLSLAAWAWTHRDARSSPPAARIVVRPFLATSGAVEPNIPRAIASALRSKLASVQGIEVIAEPSTDATADIPDPAEAARAVGAAYALTGSVSRDTAGGGRLRVLPSLVAAEDGRIVVSWPAPLVADTVDEFEVERSITEEIARALDITLGADVRARFGKRPLGSAASYELLLRAADAGDSREAREMLRRALAVDSTFSPAWAALANEATIHYVLFGGANDFADAREGSARAVATGPDLAAAHEAMGMFHRTFTHRYDSALVYMRRARELSPGDADVSQFLASVYLSAGQLDLALVEARRAAALDPRNPSTQARVVRVLLWAKRPNDAWTAHTALRALGTRSLGSAILHDGFLIRLALGDVEGARDALRGIADSVARRRAATFIFVQAMLPQLVDDTLLARVCAAPRERVLETAAWGRPLMCAESARRAGRGRQQHAWSDSALRELTEAARLTPAYPTFRMRLAWAQLLAGDTTRALATADSGLTLGRIDVDAFAGAYTTLEYLYVSALAGDAARAFRAMTALLQGPSPVTAAWLRADPLLAGVRSDARVISLLGQPPGGAGVSKGEEPKR